MKRYASDKALKYVLGEFKAAANGQPHRLNYDRILRKRPKGLKKKDVHAALEAGARWLKEEREIRDVMEAAFDSEGRPIGLFDV